jgi:signal transduction histidine kinase
VSSGTAREAQIHRARPTRALIVAIGIAIASLLALGWLALVGTPALSIGVTHEPDDRWLVTSVAPGGDAWNVGIRQGMEVIGISPADALPSGEWASMLITDGVAQITVQRQDLPPGPEPLVAGVLALGLVILAYRVVPSVAWWLLLVPPILASLAATLILDPPVSLAVEMAGPVVGALYLVDAAGSRARIARLAAIGAVALYLVGWAMSYATAQDDWVVLRNLAVVLTVGLAAMALSATIVAALARARARSGAGLSTLAPAVALGLVVDELVPGRTRTRLTAIERERARLATELHADVLPDLSAAIRSIEEGGSADDAAERLRGIAVDLRDLMGDRRLSVLEELGLVPALEGLVEQVEARTGVRIELDVENAPLGSEARPPRDVELAAYRVCQQALDNALLHARPRTIRVRLDVDAGHAELEVNDDGVGIRAGDEERALRTGHLGLTDMRGRAAAIGAIIRIGARPGGGTMVLLRWPG